MTSFAGMSNGDSMAFDSSNLTQHPLSAAYPAMEPGDFDALAADIKLHGLREPITLFEGQILDGWHRYNACMCGSVPMAFVEFDEGDPREFVISKNGHRRHLTASQRAAAIVKTMEWRPRGAQPAQIRTSTDSATTEQMAKAAHVGTSTIEQAKKAEDAGFGDLVRDGKVSAKKAAEIAKAPAKVQKAAKAALERGETPKLPKPVKTGPIDETEAAGLENDSLRESLAETAGIAKDLAEEVESMSRVFDADDKVAAAMAEAKRFREENRILRERINGLINEKNEAIKQAKYWQRKAEKVAA